MPRIPELLSRHSIALLCAMGMHGWLWGSPSYCATETQLSENENEADFYLVDTFSNYFNYLCCFSYGSNYIV